MKALPAGSFWTEPARQAHFVYLGVRLQEVGVRGRMPDR